MEINPKFRDQKQFGQLFGLIGDGALRPFGAELREDFQYRIKESLNSTLEGTSVVFTHGGVVNNLIGLFKRNIPYVGNCGFIILEFDDINKGAVIQNIFRGFTSNQIVL